MAVSPTTIHAFPELCQLAEQEARALNNASGTWTEQGLNREAIPAMLALLCDLSRDASRDAVARLVAVKVGDGWEAWSVARAVELGGTGLTSLRFKIGMEACEEWFLGGRFNSPAALTAIVRHLWPEDADER